MSTLCVVCGESPKLPKQSKCSQCLLSYRRRRAGLPQKAPKVASKIPKVEKIAPKRNYVIKIKVQPATENFADFPSTSDGVLYIGREPDLFQKISEKYGAHYSLSVARSGCARLQIHSFPANLTYKGESVQEVLTLALA